MTKQRMSSNASAVSSSFKDATSIKVKTKMSTIIFKDIIAICRPIILVFKTPVYYICLLILHKALTKNPVDTSTKKTSVYSQMTTRLIFLWGISISFTTLLQIDFSRIHSEINKAMLGIKLSTIPVNFIVVKQQSLLFLYLIGLFF